MTLARGTRGRREPARLRLRTNLSLILLAVAAQASAESLVVVDDFESIASWSAHPADRVELALAPDRGKTGGAMRMDFHFRSGAGYAVARREVALDLPGNYAFSFQVRGHSPVNHVEFKLIDRSGENVWWRVWRDVDFLEAWTPFTARKRQIQFAWGPSGGGDIRHVAAIEIVVTAGTGGQGSIWIDDLVLRPLPPPDPNPPPPPAESSSGDGVAVIDGRAETAWEPAAGDMAPWIGMRFEAPREFGGLVLDWAPGRHAADYTIETLLEGSQWSAAHTVAGGNGGRDYVYLPESEAASIRVRFAAADPPPALAEIAVKNLEWSASREAFYQAIANDAPRGSYPRGLSGEQVLWTVVGEDDDPQEGLLSEDGALETRRGAFSIEPFLWSNGTLATWAEARVEQSLDGGYLPIPSVKRTSDDLVLTVTAFATEEPRRGRSPGSSAIVARYRVENRSAEARHVTLFAAIRPFQVNPPSQSLNLTGGTAPIRILEGDGSGVRVEGAPRVACLTRAAAFGATSFDGGDVTDFLRRNALPEAQRVEDPFGAASGAFAFPMRLEPGGAQEAVLFIPLYAAPVPSVSEASAWADARLDEARKAWRARLERVTIDAPGAPAAFVESIRSQIAYVLVNRAGPAIQPGTRSYARSWIRDGSLTSTALLRMGLPYPVREFIEWFAPHQYPNGKVPCVVDARGADPVPEHDSSGEFIYLVTEFYRYTADREFVERHWPRVLAAAGYLDSLRQERRTPEFLAPDTLHVYGLLPPSISHEGYSAKPMHSYWDDFFALRGFRDAVFLAQELGYAEDAARLAAILAEFETDLAASVLRAAARHRIDYVPGCADLGDFDATSTTIAFDPTGAASILPDSLLLRTFERYYAFFVDRRAGAPWEAFTPYEIRNIGAFVRLGWRDRAEELIAFFLQHQWPPGWRQWSEVVRSKARKPAFLGDLPHSWVGSDFVRSALDCLAYERHDRRALVLGAGVPRAWLERGPVAVRGLVTPYGLLDYTMMLEGEEVRVEIGEGLRVPPEGIEVRPPLSGPSSSATIDGAPAEVSPDGAVRVLRVPAVVRVQPHGLDRNR